MLNFKYRVNIQRQNKDFRVRQYVKLIIYSENI